MSFDTRDKAAARKIFLFVVLPLAVMTVYAFWFIAQQLPPDANSKCTPSDKDEPHTVFLIDGSDTFSKNHLTALERIMEETITKMHTHERLSIFLIDGEQPALLPKPKSFFCKPPKDIEHPLIQGQGKELRAEYKKFEEENLKPIYAYLEKPKSSNESPIMEMIGNITNQYERFSPAVEDRKLIVFSDLVEHLNPEIEPSLDSCSEDYPLNFSEFKKTEFYKRIKPNLDGVKTSIFYVHRKLDKRNGSGGCAAKLQQRSLKQHQQFWREFLTDSGAIIKTFGIIRD